MFFLWEKKIVYYLITFFIAWYLIVFIRYDMKITTGQFLYRILYHWEIVCTSKNVFNVKMWVNEQNYYILIKILYSKTFLGKEQKEYRIRCEGYNNDVYIYVVHCVVWQQSLLLFFFSQITNKAQIWNIVRESFKGQNKVVWWSCSQHIQIFLFTLWSILTTSLHST